MPVEVSELFTYTYLYEYLHKNKKKLDIIQHNISKNEKNTFFSKDNLIPFDGRQHWQTQPFSYHIAKDGGESSRKMSIPQPLSVINLYFFISLYQKDILNVIDHPIFSIRYHKRNDELFYEKSHSRIIDYKYGRDPRKKKVLEQSGRYFNIRPYYKAQDIQRSERWYCANSNFKLFCKIDYKRCFDSIYTHTYNSIVMKDTNDAKRAHNSSLFTVIDRVLQNINGTSSNGILIGPEFSRMMAEILLQQIDREVFATLSENDIIQGKDYNIMRFIDDIFIFCNQEDTLDKILKSFDNKANKYRLEINQQKTVKQSTPFKNSDWIKDALEYLNTLSQIIRSNNNVHDNLQDFRIKCEQSDLLKIKEQFEQLLAKYKDTKHLTQRVTNYMVSSVYNLVSSTMPKDIRFFKAITESGGNKTANRIIDYLFFLYSYSINFENTQKLISMLYYLNDELNLKTKANLQKIIEKYEKKITLARYSEYINLLVAFRELGMYFTSQYEQKIYNDIASANDPIALATFLHYCQYNKTYSVKISGEVNDIIKRKLDCIILNKKGCAQLYEEYWYALIFQKCPYIKSDTKNKCEKMIRESATNLSKNINEPAYQTASIIKDFFLDKKESHGLIAWNKRGARMLEEITYRTSNRTVFRHRGGSDFDISF